MTWAEIFTGESDTAEVFFLFGAILSVLAAVMAMPRRPPASAGFATSLAYAALACISIGWMLL